MRRRRGHALRHRYGRAFGQKAAQTTPEFEAALSSFVANAQTMIDRHTDESFAASRAKVDDPTFGAVKLALQRGPKYIRVVRNDVFAGEERPGGVYCFIDTTNGNILKAASFKTPAKHARGNIFDANPLSAVTQYGAQYIRR